MISIGLDLSLTATGIAGVRGDTRVVKTPASMMNLRILFPP